MSGLIDRLIGACITGERCGQAITLDGLAIVAKRGLWHDAVKAILSLETIHPASQQRFARAWVLRSFARYFGEDRDLFFPFLRKVMPPYTGEDVHLFRGQLADEPLGTSWTIAPWIALKFALFGCRDINPVTLLFNVMSEPRPNAVILQGRVPAARIISVLGPLENGGYEGEFIVDSRGLEFSSEPAEGASEWVRREYAASLNAIMLIYDMTKQVCERHGGGNEPLSELVARAAMAGDGDAQFVLDTGILSTHFAGVLAREVHPSSAGTSSHAGVE